MSSSCRLLLCGYVTGSEIVVKRLNGEYSRVFDLAVPNLPQGALGDARCLRDGGKVSVFDRAKPSQNAVEEFGLFHAAHFQPIYGLRQPTLEQPFAAISHQWVKAQ